MRRPGIEHRPTAVGLLHARNSPGCDFRRQAASYAQRARGKQHIALKRSGIADVVVADHVVHGGKEVTEDVVGNGLGGLLVDGDSVLPSARQRHQR
jgi:hypothetical protein